jgi:uncharacterized protein (DUF1015 family)
LPPSEGQTSLKTVSADSRANRLHLNRRLVHRSTVAQFGPLEAFLYDPDVAGDPGTLIAPPYDVVSAQDAAALHALSAFNISRVDYGESRVADDAADNRYSRAHASIRDWIEKGALKRQLPAMYLYDQDFMVAGRRYRRRAIFGRLRLEEWEAGVVRPHEHTRAAAKEDRYELLKATRVQLSPIMGMYRRAGVDPLVDLREAGPPILSARLGSERHVLRALSAEAAGRLQEDLEDRPVYVADGHHRYETALSYRNERRAAAPSWTGNESENFVLTALVDVEDPGLVVLPTHRLLRMPGPFDDLTGRLAPRFAIADAGDASHPSDVEELLAAMKAAGQAGTAFGCIGLRRGRLHLLTLADQEDSGRQVPEGHSPVWRDLDVNVLQYGLYPLLGNLSRPEDIEFTEDPHEAAREVVEGRWDVAVLVNRTPVTKVLECADAGERMPQKSTFFFPKLATGLVMYPLD